MAAEQTPARAGGTRARLAEAALDLFESQGFDSTTVDQIVGRAGVSKTTFFRHFRTKEEVIFPDHATTLADIATMFELSADTDRLSTVYSGARHVLSRYVEEGEVARRRYRLTSSVPALRDAEVASIQLYHRLFRRHLAEGAGTDWRRQLTAELQAAGIVAANNFVIRRWLRGEITDPLTEFEQLKDRVLGTSLSEAGRRPAERSGSDRARSTVVIFESEHDLDDVVRQVGQALQRDGSPALAPTTEPGGASDGAPGPARRR